MKAIKVIRDPEAFQLLADQTRRKIVFLLRVKEMTVSQIAAELNITPQAVYHHIKRLQKGDLIEVAREERIGHLIESYYQATAETFFCSVGETWGTRKLAREQVLSVLTALNQLGFNLATDEEKISQLIDVRRKLNGCCNSGTFEEAISKLVDVDFLTQQVVQEYAETLAMSDEEFAKKQGLNKQFRELLMSMVL